MGVINTSSFSKAIWPGINAWYGKEYAEYPEEWTQLFDSYTSVQAYEEDVGVTSFGLAQEKPEGQSVAYDEEKQAFITRYVHVVFALGFIVTREIFEDDRYDVVGQKRARGLAFSMRQTKEVVAANVYNRAFNSSYTGGDGKELLATDHPNFAGGTWANELTTAADLSESSLEQAVIDIAALENDRGLQIAVQPRCLVVPSALQFEAERILMSPYRSGSADNDVNALKDMAMFPEGVKVNHYITPETNDWFIRTNCPDSLKYFSRRDMQFAIDNDFDTENAKFKASERYSFGWTDPRGLFGSPGTS